MIESRLVLRSSAWWVLLAFIPHGIIQSQMPVPVYRLYNPGGDHLLTSSCGERWSVQSSASYVEEGVAGYVMPAAAQGEVPLYRLFSGHEHFYTTDANERSHLILEAHWNDEGIIGYVSTARSDAPTGRALLYRLYNPATAYHLLTRDFNERQALLRAGWKDEGVTGTIWTSGSNACANAQLTYPAEFYDHTYFRGSQHIETKGTLGASGALDGSFRYENDSQWGFCGGVTVFLADSEGKLVKVLTPPTGCIDGKGIGGHAISRTIPIRDQLSAGDLQRVRVIKVVASETCAADKLFGSLPTPIGTLDINKAYQLITGCHAP